MISPISQKPCTPLPRKCLTFDLAYSLRGLREHGQERHILQRDLEGYFSHVFTIYPLLGVDPADSGDRFVGLKRTTTLTAQHTFIEHKAFAFRKKNIASLLASQGALILECCRLVVREKIGVIRATDPFVTGPMAYAIGLLTGRPFCMRLGANYDALAQQGILPYPRLFSNYEQARAIGKFILRRCNLLLPANEDYKGYAIRNGARPDRCVTVPYGSVIATEHFVPPEGRGPPPRDFPTSSEPVAIVVGRLIEVKRPFEILDATAHISQLLPRAKVLMIGDGPLREPLMKACRERKLEDNILFLGSRDQEWLVRAYPNCTAYLSPLTGRALAEAALAGIPAIAYDCDWHSELVKTGKTGTLVPVGDTAAMANAFVDLVKRPEKRKELGRNARSLALEMMAPDRVLHRERAAFSQLLEAWPSP